MPETLKTVAVLVANPALSSILTSTLAGVRSLRVRPFETALALTTYLRLVPADLVVIDFDNTDTDALAFAKSLRADTTLAARKLQVVALASKIDTTSKQAAIAAGIDEIIAKPMSPRYLVERVLARLLRVLPQAPAPLLRRQMPTDWSRFGDNIVPLVRPSDRPTPRLT